MTDRVGLDVGAIAATAITVIGAFIVAPDATYQLLFGIPEPGSGPTVPPLILLGGFAIMLLTAVIFEAVVIGE